MTYPALVGSVKLVLDIRASLLTSGFPSPLSILAIHPAEQNIGSVRDINQGVVGNFWLVLNIREDVGGAKNISTNHRHQGGNVEPFLSIDT